MCGLTYIKGIFGDPMDGSPIYLSCPKGKKIDCPKRPYNKNDRTFMTL